MDMDWFSFMLISMGSSIIFAYEEKVVETHQKQNSWFFLFMSISENFLQGAINSYSFRKLQPSSSN